MLTNNYILLYAARQRTDAELGPFLGHGHGPYHTLLDVADPPSSGVWLDVLVWVMTSSLGPLWCRGQVSSTWGTRTVFTAGAGWLAFGSLRLSPFSHGTMLFGFLGVHLDFSVWKEMKSWGKATSLKIHQLILTKVNKLSVWKLHHKPQARRVPRFREFKTCCIHI